MNKTLFVVGLALVLSVSTASAAAKKGSWTGWISDDKCGAKGSNENHAACAEKCIKGGAKAVFVSDKDGSVLEVSNQDAVTGHAGHHVKVTGALDADSKTLTVNKVAMLGKAGGKKEKKEKS